MSWQQCQRTGITIQPQKPEPNMSLNTKLPVWRCALGAVVALLTGAALAHTLPVSYLRLATEADYLHLELTFNPFELTFRAEVDDNHDAEISPAELARHGSELAERVVGALQLSVNGQRLRPETTGMDPDLSGHHVRVRAHFKVDARHLPLTVASDLIAITSASHLTQVTYANGTNLLKAQLDSQSRRVTFQPPLTKLPAPAPVAPNK